MSFSVPMPSVSSWVNVRGTNPHMRIIKRRPSNEIPVEARRDRKKRDRQNRKASRR